MTLDGVTSFSRIKTYEIHINASITDQNFGGISFYVMAENWQHLKVHLPYRRFYDRNRVLRTSDFLHNIPLVVSQSSVNISLALRANRISN